MSSSLTRCDLVDPPNNPFPASILQEAISINHRYHLSWLLQVVHQIISLNKSTLSYWWRGGRELNGWVNNEANLMNFSSCWILSITLYRSQVEHFFDEADTNNNGKMSFEEFVQSWNETKTISK